VCTSIIWATEFDNKEIDLCLPAIAWREGDWRAGISVFEVGI
jgi:hypothetical protein